MIFLDEVRAKRQKLADILCDEDYSGIRDIVEELYPDRAHFIYELLQNAEDAGATKASFLLEEKSVSFEHNGLPFSKEDVWGITNIGKGTKKDQEDKIGRFGVGFKAVFAYSETPHIWSPTFSFKISDLVLPAAIAARPDLGQATRFEFPFNNAKKCAQDAYVEIEAGLNELAETTLLFLSSLESICWQIGKETQGKVLRIPHSKQHIEVQKQTGGKTVSSSHFLRFSDSVAGLDKMCVAIAFALDHLPDVTGFDRTKPLAKQLKIIPASPGRVAVFFPAEKETSGLRFHLHAPFVPELSRASIKETAANEPLFQQLANLTAAALHGIRDLKLLTADLLGVLPNPSDDIPERYEPIREAIVAEMNNQRLTPTQSKSHAPAKHLLQGKALLKELLSAKDIEFLIDGQEVPLQWAASAAQKHSDADRFLSSLAITEWDVNKFIEVLERKSSEKGHYISVAPWQTDGPDPQFMAWLAAKSVEWHQQMYAMLFSELQSVPQYKRNHATHRLKHLRIVRLSDGRYGIGERCYFPSDGVEHDEVLPRVAQGLYSSGKSKGQHEDSRKLLEELGVREVGEVEQVEAILKQRYTRESQIPSEKTYWKDLKRFIALVEKEPTSQTMFAGFYIFQLASGDWATSQSVYLDSPYLETGLKAYYDAIKNPAPKAALSAKYKQSGIPIEKLKHFAEVIGVQKQLKVQALMCSGNPNWSELQIGSVRKARNDSYKRHEEDFDIPELKVLTSLQNIEASRLIWRTMTTVVKTTELVATYRRNNESPLRRTKSRLVDHLVKAAWIPQTSGRFVRPAEASPKLLPKGFPFDAGEEWIKAIHFGEVEQKHSEELKQTQTAAERLGFPDADSLERAKRFAAIPQSEQERILADFLHKQHPELPQHEPRNPERRAEQVGRHAADAPERVVEARTRSVSVGREDVKHDAEQYLRQQYTNADGEMICQVCKAVLPFKLDDGRFYFEKVELFPELKKRHYQNYLALCPNHSAMFTHANGSRELITTNFTGIETNHLEVVLAQQDATIYFTKTHIADLKKVIEVDGRLASDIEPR